MNEIKEVDNVPVESEKKLSGDTLSVYSQILGLPERRYPTANEFPKTLTLDPHLLGDFLKARKQTVKDGLERSQSVSWDEKSNKFKTDELKVGTNTTTGLNDLEFRAFLARVFFGNKPLFEFHTHSSKGSEHHASFSGEDVAFMRAYPRMGYISGVGSKEGGMFAFQSAESASLPFSYKSGYSKAIELIGGKILEYAEKYEKKLKKSSAELTEKEEQKMMQAAYRVVEIPEVKKFLKETGYGLYFLAAPQSENSKKEIVLKRI